MFGQVVVGPPGSGKTTYCKGMQQFLSAIGRKVAVINLDPANDSVPYPCSVDMNELITLEDVMNEYTLGPNGGLIFCMEYLEKNLDWLFAKLEALSGHYLIFDCPGQVELYTHHDSMCNIVSQLQKRGYRIASVHLVDSFYCSSPSNYVAALLVSLSTMLQLELPHVNVLSKIDLVEKFGKLDLNLEFYTTGTDLEYLQHALNREDKSGRFSELNRTLCELIEDFSLVSFTTLNINEKESVARLVKLIDKSNGYVYSAMDGDSSLLEAIATADVDFEYYRVGAVQEKYMDTEVDLQNWTGSDEEDDIRGADAESNS
eukprot:TRINITY_DN10224_c0_g1_i1.p1 TRINITY_DN10224_c0_g1~~TRINITY_DN10224_c0_g1_i1.p1  ORF type:complete len:316 (+),score=75.21 TRINITY_DN10224_c0_g1_i1:161-1108(+)